MSQWSQADVFWKWPLHYARQELECFSVRAFEEWIASREYVSGLGKNSRLEHLQRRVRRAVESGDKEQRMTAPLTAAAGILRAHTNCLEYLHSGTVT